MSIARPSTSFLATHAAEQIRMDDMSLLSRKALTSVASVPDLGAVPMLASDTSDTESESELEDNFVNAVDCNLVLLAPPAVSEVQQATPLVPDAATDADLLEGNSNVGSRGGLSSLIDLDLTDPREYIPLTRGNCVQDKQETPLAGIGAQSLSSSCGLHGIETPDLGSVQLV